MIDAAGAIYVIGGGTGGFDTKFFNDVWVSTDGGADRTRVGILGGYLGRDAQGTHGDVKGYAVGTERGTHGYSPP